MRKLLESKLVKKRVYYKIYTIVFLCFFLCVFLTFFIRNKSVIWQADGLTQYFPNILYFRKWAKELLYNIFVTHTFEIPMWDMTLGEGVNVLNVINFRPLYWISLLFPGKYLELYFWIRLAVSMYLSGLFFLLFVKFFKKLDFASLIGSIIYVFSGLVLFYFFKHVVFLELNVFLPLMLLGTEKILKNKSSKIFICSVALSGLSYFYNLYIITIFAVLYALIRFFFIFEEKNLKVFLGKIIVFTKYYFIGLTLSAISLIPNLILAMSSSRVSGASSSKLSFLYDIEYYFSLITSLLDKNSAGNYGYICFPAIVVLLMFNLFCRKKEKNAFEKQISISIYVGFLLMLFPIFAYIFNGGGSITNRWFFVTAFAGGLIVAFELNNNIKIYKNFYVITGLYCIVSLLISIFQNMSIEFWIFIGIILALYGYITSADDLKINKRRYQIIMILLLLIEIGYKAHSYYGISGENYAGQFLDAGTVENVTYNVAANAMSEIEDDDLYRVDSVELDWNSPFLNRNYGQRVGVNGLSSYYSYMSSELIFTLDQLGLSQKYQNFAISSYDQRTILNELSSVKYVTVKNTEHSYVPYGYEYVKDVGDISIFKNKYFLPIMYGYDSKISMEKYETLSSYEKEEAMLQGCIYEGDFLPETQLNFESRTVLSEEDIEQQIYEQSGVRFNKDGITCETSSTFYLQPTEAITGEVYVVFEGVEYENLQEASRNSSDSGLIHAGMNGTYKKGYVFGKNHQYYEGKKEMILNLGYVSSYTGTIELIFPTAGQYNFENVKIVVKSMETYANHVDDLKLSVDNLVMSTNKISADLNTTENKVVCVAVPYDAGWKAELNGKTIDLFAVNGRYLGFELESGRNHIELKYSIPGIYLGSALSIGGVILIFFYNLYKKIKKRER